MNQHIEKNEEPTVRKEKQIESQLIMLTDTIEHINTIVDNLESALSKILIPDSDKQLVPDKPSKKGMSNVAHRIEEQINNLIVSRSKLRAIFNRIDL